MTQPIFVESLSDQPACPRCTGRGWIFERTGPVFPNDYTCTPCPCGGTDRDRIDVDVDVDDGAFARAVIEEFQGVDLDTDRCVFEAVRHKLGHNAFTDDALTLMAEEYQRRARQAERRDHSRRIRSSRQGGLH